MTRDALTIIERQPIVRYEETIPIRGCSLSLQDIKHVYRDLLLINKKFGEQLISTLQREPDLTDDEWEKRKAFLLDDAFRLTITVRGLRDQQVYAETVAIFDDPKLPKPIKSIFFTNATAFRRHAKEDPMNRLSVFLDFSKPEIFDPNPLVSAATPNESEIIVDAQDITFFHAVQRAIETKIFSKKTWFAAIHRNFAYDIGMWIIYIPISLYFSAYYMDQILPIGSNFELYRWPLFVYFVGLSLLTYRGLTAYAKWAFPVNVLEENKDRALKHRLALGAIASWLLYKVASTVYSAVVTYPL